MGEHQSRPHHQAEQKASTQENQVGKQIGK